ncbi:MAG: ATP-binding protein [Candidatus Methylomirabilales bacterium]
MSEQHSPSPTDAHGQVLHDLAVSVGRAHKVEQVIQTAAAEIRLAFGVRIAGLYLRDLSSGILTAGPHEEFSPIYAATIKPNESLIIDESITSKKVGIWPVEAMKHPAIRAGLDAEGCRIVACVPLLSKAEPLGVALIARRSDVPFSPLELHTLRAIGSIIGVAIENAKLYEELVSHRDQLRALAAAVQQTREVEARRIARDLHDIAGQLLAAIHFKLEELAEALPLQAQEHLEAVRGQLHQAEEHLRRLSHELRSPILDDLGLKPALDSLGKGVAARTGLHITVEGSLGPRPSREIETVMYRSVQEGLTNVAKHARASRVWIELERQPQQIRCTVRDDGIGFEVRAALAKWGRQGIGLLSIQERVAEVGGRATITSAPGEGTELRLTIPLQDEDVVPEPDHS